MYVDVLSITPESVRLVWTIGVETGHGEAITGYDIEAETHYRPGVWKSIMTGKTQDLYITFCQVFGTFNTCTKPIKTTNYLDNAKTAL